jgi:hypothetical protein
MAEVLVKYTEPVRAADGTSYWAQACGDIASNKLWEGWIEFASEGRALRTGRETEQPNRDDLIYWAEGLTYPYLQGALDRALRLESGPAVLDVDMPAEPLFDAPAKDRPIVRRVAIEPRAILDPYVVYAEGENILRQQLRALSRDQLANIARAHHLTDASPGSILEHGSREQLAAHIVRSVKGQNGGAAGDRALREREEQ